MTREVTLTSWDRNVYGTKRRMNFQDDSIIVIQNSLVSRSSVLLNVSCSASIISQVQIMHDSRLNTTEMMWKHMFCSRKHSVYFNMKVTQVLINTLGNL